MIRGRIFGTVIFERHEIGLIPPRSTTRIRDPRMTTSHYAGPTDWRTSTIDRSTADRFRLTTDHGRCPLIMRSHQSFHMRPVSQGGRGWVDYAYSGAFCPHGVGYLGRGRGVRTAANGTTVGNDTSYALQYMGGGVADPLTVEAKRAAIDLADYLGKTLQREHADWKSTSCSGPQIRPWRRAGFPRPPGAETPPSPVPQEDDDDMIIHFYCDGRPARVVVDGVVHGWRTNTARSAFIKGIKNAKQDTVKFPTVADYEAFTSSMLQGQDLDRLNEAVDKAIEEWSPLFAASAMRLQAILEVEAREEQRDTTGD
jgi:hypothetical protein